MALLVAVVAMVASVGQARASGKSAKVPTDLKALLVKFDKQCLAFSSPGTQCEGSPFAIKYFAKHPFKGYKQFAALYKSMAAVCNTMRPSTNDGGLASAGTWADRSEAQLDCSWGKVGTGSNAGNNKIVAVTIKVPMPGHTRRPQPCYHYQSTLDASSCRSIGSGARAAKTDPVLGGVLGSPNFFQILDTPGLLLEVQRLGTEKYLYAHQSDDLQDFIRIAKAFRVPSSSL